MKPIFLTCLNRYNNMLNKNNVFCVTRWPTVEEKIKELFSYPWRYIYYA